MGREATYTSLTCIESARPFLASKVDTKIEGRRSIGSPRSQTTEPELPEDFVVEKRIKD